MPGEFSTTFCAKVRLLAHGYTLAAHAEQKGFETGPRCFEVALMQPPELCDGRIGSQIDPDLALALEAALAAGACRRAAVLNPDSRMIWLSVAEAKRKDALAHLREWAMTVAQPIGRSRA